MFKLLILLIIIIYSLEAFFIDYEEEEGTTAILTINHPKSLNALNIQILEELDIILDIINHNKITSLIITGSGEKSFISGVDISEISILTKTTSSRIFQKRK